MIHLNTSHSMSPSPASLPVNAESMETLEQTLTQKKWNERWNDKLDEFLPNNSLQTSLDEFGRKIEELLQPAHQFSNWIDRTEDGWFTNLSLSLVKLPLAAVRNVLRLIYNIAKALVYLAVHPIKFLVDALHFLTELIKSLAKPETYTKIGAGIVGSSLSQMVFTGGVSCIGLALGVALIGIGLAAGAIVAHVKGESVADAAYKQLKTIPECMLTGFLIGLVVGALKQLFTAKHVTVQNHTLDDAAARDFVNQYIKNFPKQYPTPTEVHLLPDGTIIASWKGADLIHFVKVDPLWMDNLAAPLENGGLKLWGLDSYVNEFRLTFHPADSSYYQYMLTNYPPHLRTNMYTGLYWTDGTERSVMNSGFFSYPEPPTSTSISTSSSIPGWVPNVSGSAAILKKEN